MAGGLDQNAGSRIKITRQLGYGRIPIAGAGDDGTGQFSIAEIPVKTVVDARSPEKNVLICPHDVISVPRAEMVYVVGEVARSGGFPLNEREKMTTLQALALAGGLERVASPKNARVLRRSPSGERTEMRVDLQAILTGKGEDIALAPDDILFVPSSAPKRAAIRAAEAAIQMGTGIVIWRHWKAGG